MMVFLKQRLVVLSMPKCGSTALETAFAPYADVVISGVPQAKHTTFRKYDRFLRRYFETFAEAPLEVVCAFREPLDWLGSWYRYRNRDQLAGRENSTKGLSFDGFLTMYLEGQPGPAKVGRQAQFVSDKDGQVGVDQIWRYDNLDAFASWLAGRVDVGVELQRLNVSPGAIDTTVDDALDDRVRKKLSREFEIYAELAQ